MTHYSIDREEEKGLWSSFQFVPHFDLKNKRKRVDSGPWYCTYQNREIVISLKSFGADCANANCKSQADHEHTDAILGLDR